MTPDIYRSHKCIEQKLQRKDELSANRRDLQTTDRMCRPLEICHTMWLSGDQGLRKGTPWGILPLRYAWPPLTCTFPNLLKTLQEQYQVRKHRKSQQSLRSLNQVMTKEKQSSGHIFTAALLSWSGDSPQPLPNRLLQAERSGASSFQFWCLVFSLRLSSSCLLLLPPSIPFYVYFNTSFGRQIHRYKFRVFRCWN